MEKAKALTIPCSFGDVSIGEATCRIGVNVARSALKLNVADAQVCGKRLVGSIVSLPGNDNPEQGQLIKDEITVGAAFDVKRVSFNKKFISFGLTFSIESVNIEDLAHFAKRAGRIEADDIQDIPAEEKTDDE